MINTLVAQFPITLDIKQNLEIILSITNKAEDETLVVLPEGALSGYEEDPKFLDHVDLSQLQTSLQILRKLAALRNIHLVFGSCLHEDGKWFNAGIYYSRDKEFIYHKVNLATNERLCFTAGASLSFLETRINDQPLKLAIQLCREIRFPEQWRSLARQGTEIFTYLTNAVGDSTQSSVWRSHLISRAAENQRFVLCANNAHSTQKCPSMIITPSGNVLWETLSSDIEIARQELDLAQVSNWYLNQSRRDLITIS